MSHCMRTLRVDSDVGYPTRGDLGMGFLLAMLADIVFESAAERPRAFAREMDRYFEERGLVPPPQRGEPTTR